MDLKIVVICIGIGVVVIGGILFCKWYFKKPKNLNELTYEEIEQMKNRARYGMTHLHGRVGRDIFETIRNTPKADHTQLKKECEEFEKHIKEANKKESNRNDI